jgi:hypothetical protein
MSIDIDMETYAGASIEPAAAVQQTDTNSYQQEASEYPVDESLLDKPAEQAAEPEPSKQELNFRALTQEVDRMKAEREAEKKEYQLQLDMLRANLEQQHAPKVQQERKFLDGMKEEDIPNVGELRREWENKEAVYQARLEELQVAQQYPDYAEVMEKHLSPLVKQKPHLIEGIQGARNKALFAYELGKMAQQMQGQKVEVTRSENAQRIVENAKKPGTLSQAGGQGALSKADYYASMSDQEFMRMASRNLEGI